MLNFKREDENVVSYLQLYSIKISKYKQISYVTGNHFSN